MIVNIRKFATNLFYWNNISNEKYWAKSRALWNTMYVKIRKIQEELIFTEGVLDERKDINQLYIYKHLIDRVYKCHKSHG